MRVQKTSAEGQGNTLLWASRYKGRQILCMWAENYSTGGGKIRCMKREKYTCSQHEGSGPADLLGVQEGEQEERP